VSGNASSPARRLRFLAPILVLLAATAAATASAAVLRYAFERAETGFDPAQISDDYSRTIAANLFDAPLRYAYLGPPGTLEPNTTATLPVVSPDFRVFTLTLRPGIYFADDPAFGGRRRELVAADYVYTIKRFADPRWKSPVWSSIEEVAIVGLKAARDAAQASGRFDYDAAVAGLQVLDRYRFRITLERPAPHFVDLLADPSQLGAVAREVVERYGDAVTEHPVGTGPFVLAHWRRSSLIVLDRNPGYRDETYPPAPPGADDRARALARDYSGRRLPMVDRVEITPIEENQPRWLAFLDAEHDVLERMPLQLAPLAVKRTAAGTAPTPLLDRRGIRIVRRPEIDVTLAVYNMDDPVVGGYGPPQVALRRALNLGLNVDDVIRLVYAYQGTPAQTLMQPGTSSYDPSWRTENGDYDPARANALLDVYGYVPGPDGWRRTPAGAPLVLTMTLTPDQAGRQLAEIARRSFRVLGVHVEFRFGQWPQNLRRVQQGDFQIWTVAMSANSPNSQDVMRLAFSGSIGAYDLCRMNLPAYDALYREATRQPDGPERSATLQRMNELEVAYAPMKAIAHRYKIDLVHPWVRGYLDTPYIYDWWRYVDIDARRLAEDGR